MAKRSDSAVETRPMPLPALLLDIRKDSQGSVVSNGEMSPHMRRLYVPDEIDDEIAAWLTDPKIHLLILTGSAGHGKSAAIANARKLAQDAGIPLAIRFDATHSNKRQGSYREALRTFLTPFAQGKSPKSKHLLAMNLGLALDFFTGDEADRKKFAAIGAAFDQGFALGIGFTESPHPSVKIIDLTRRMKLAFDPEANRASVPFVERLLNSFSSEHPGPVQDAVKGECEGCDRRRQCPVFLNIALLSRPEVRTHVSHAIMAGALERGLHLTPRNLLDIVSRITVPQDLEPEVDPASEICSLRLTDSQVMTEAGEDPAKTWGRRLHLTLFDLAFPRGDEKGGEDLAILRSMQFEDPAQIRSEIWDKQILQWMADPSSLQPSLPKELTDYLGAVGNFFLGAKGLPLAIRSMRWTKLDAREERLIDEFVALCLGTDAALAKWETKLTEALTRIAAQRYDDQPVRGTTKLALHLEGVSSTVRVLADMLPIHIGIRKAAHGTSVSNPFFHAVVSTGDSDSGEPLLVDWHRFQLLNQVLDGYVPPTRPGPHFTFMSEVRRRLAVASNMSSKVTMHRRDAPKPVQLTAKTTGGRFQVTAEVLDATS